MSSLGHNEEIVGGADMVWKLCDKEECPKFKLLIELLFVLCEKMARFAGKQQRILDG